MSYNINFSAKLEGVEQTVLVGDNWLNFTSNAAAMIKEVCGTYPSDWNGRKCSDMYPVLMQGASLLNIHPEKYRIFETSDCWGNVEQTRDFLMRVADNCDRYPTAVIAVSY